MFLGVSTGLDLAEHKCKQLTASRERDVKSISPNSSEEIHFRSSMSKDSVMEVMSKISASKGCVKLFLEVCRNAMAALRERDDTSVRPNSSEEALFRSLSV